jgi:hypothetical protein
LLSQSDPFALERQLLPLGFSVLGLPASRVPIGCQAGRIAGTKVKTDENPLCIGKIADQAGSQFIIIIILLYRYKDRRYRNSLPEISHARLIEEPDLRSRRSFQ